MSVHFEVPFLPTAKGRPRHFFNKHVGRVIVSTPAATRKAEETTASLAAQHAPPTPFHGPLMVSLVFMLPAPQSWPQWKRLRMAEFYPIARPDLDNYIKLILDAIQATGTFWRDDAQVVTLVARKAFGLKPCTVVTIEQLTEPEYVPRRRPAVARHLARQLGLKVDP